MKMTASASSASSASSPLHDSISEFNLSKSSGLDDHVYIKRYRNKQYLVIDTLTFELGSDEPLTNETHINHVYYIHPDTFEFGHIYAHIDALEDPVYYFKTKSHDFRESWNYNDIHREIQAAGYLRVGTLVNPRGANPEKAFEWLKRVSNK